MACTHFRKPSKMFLLDFQHQITPSSNQLLSYNELNGGEKSVVAEARRRSSLRTWNLMFDLDL